MTSRSATASNAITSRRCTSMTTTSSWCCTLPSSGAAVTCTTSSSTSSSDPTISSPCTAPSARLSNPTSPSSTPRTCCARSTSTNLPPTTPLELTYSIGSALVRREIDLVAALARESGRLEQQVTDKDHNDDPEALLEDLFEVGHQLLAIRTMATHSAETYRGLAKRI